MHNVADPRVWGGNSTLKSIPSRHIVSSNEPLLPKNGSIILTASLGGQEDPLCAPLNRAHEIKGSTCLCGRSKDVMYGMNHVIFKTCICGGYKSRVYRFTTSVCTGC